MWPVIAARSRYCVLDIQGAHEQETRFKTLITSIEFLMKIFN